MKLKLSIILLVLFCTSINLTGNSLFIYDKTKDKQKTLQPAKVLKQKPDYDSVFSSKKLGSFVENGNTVFRLFAPDAGSIMLVTFTDVKDTIGTEYNMIMDEQGVWETSLPGEQYGLFYGFRIKNPKQKYRSNVLCVDPYAKAVATYNTYWSPRKSIVIKENDYDWQDDDWIKHDWSDLIIYEMHVRDMTAHPSSGANQPGTYNGLVEKNITGGINYIKKLGVNAVELLPSQEFANIEIPFKDSLNGRYNDWNPYERNHWGYMTAAFFAPEAYYNSENSSDKKLKQVNWNEWQGQSASQVKEFKDMVKAFHKEGIAVIMDVVYNHLSEYEIGNLKQIDKDYYFRLDKDGNYRAESGTGNDLKTERPMLRKLILESLIYWMKEYHVDGFRFDLGKLIDWETVETIIHECQKINPSVVIVCEPWGGGYDPMGFSMRGWGSWNDQIRNGVKGENPNDGLGWIFGKWYGNNNTGRIKSYVNGTLIKDHLGLFQRKEHAVNYLESHDGYTLGDFIRIGLKDVKPDEVIKNVDENAKLTPEQLKLNKLGALFLFTSQGITMIHSGQEFARSKVIVHDDNVNDPHEGTIDHNSYEKDNNTNYINYDHAALNKELVDYYRGLIQLRKTYPAFRRAEYGDVKFRDISKNEFALEYQVTYDKDNFIVLFNANVKETQEFTLPAGNWDVLVNEHKAGTTRLEKASGKLVLQPSTGMVLRKNR